MAALLGKDADTVPAGAYTSDSLHHVAGLHRFFPVYAEVRDALEAWWSCNRPRPSSAVTLPGIDIPEELTAADRGWVHFWHKRRGEIWAKDGTQGEQDAALAKLASLVRTESPKAWAVIRGPEVGVPVASEAVVAAVAATLEAHRAERQSARLAEEPAARVPLPDVALRGAHLRAARERRGVKVAG